MKSVNFNNPPSVMEFLERHCGLNLEDVNLTYSFHYIKLDCNDETIIDAEGETELGTFQEAHRQLDSYYQMTAIKQFLPDILQDLQKSFEKGKACKQTMAWLKGVATLLHDNYPNENQ